MFVVRIKENTHWFWICRMGVEWIITLCNCQHRHTIWSENKILKRHFWVLRVLDLFARTWFPKLQWRRLAKLITTDQVFWQIFRRDFEGLKVLREFNEEYASGWLCSSIDTEYNPVKASVESNGMGRKTSMRRICCPNWFLQHTSFSEIYLDPKDQISTKNK